MKSYAARLGVTFGVTLAADLLGVAWYRAFLGGLVLPAAVLAFFGAYPSLVFGLFADERSWWRRLGYVTVSGVAAVLGTVAVMVLWP